MHVASVATSSAQGPSAGYTFTADNLVDGALTTSWQPSKTATSPHWIRLELADEVTVTEVAIANGFQTTDRIGDEFLLNQRISRARIRFGSAGEIPVTFSSDARGLVRFAIPRKKTRSIEVLIDETHPGTKWQDLAVSEVAVKGIISPKDGTSTAATAEWWTPPAGRRLQVEALAYGFAGVSEADLGSVYTSDLKPVYGAPKLFEEKPAQRIPRDEMQHFVLKLRQRIQLDAGFSFLFIRAGTKHDLQRDYEVVRAMQVTEVVRIDESARMRRPPDEAVFYLAEIHKGASFDLLIEGERAAMGKQLDLALEKGSGRYADVNQSGNYRLKAFGLGLRDYTGDGIFAETPQQIAERYRTGEPVPVQLVFRTIPGRSYEPRELAVPQPVIDEPVFSLDEFDGRSWNVKAGRYWIDATSGPNGMKLEWDGQARCDQTLEPGVEYRGVKMNCTVTKDSKLKVSNPSTFGAGGAETMSVYVARQP